jgi:hypothetical protein
MPNANEPPSSKELDLGIWQKSDPEYLEAEEFITEVLEDEPAGLPALAAD